LSAGNGATSNARHAGGREKKTEDTEIVKQAGENFNEELFPKNLLLLQSRGRKAEYRPASRDIRAECELCDGKVLIDGTRPWFWHFGKSDCPVSRMKDFNAVLWRLR
jgi:hypothetical protein